MYMPKKDRQRPSAQFHGMYRGEVVDVDDPYEAGRIKVLVYGVFDGLSADQLPWAIFSDPLMGGQEGIGGFIVPDVGSHVWVFFEEGDHTQPVYFAGAPARPHGPPERNENTTYPRNKVLRTMAGHVIEIDDSPDATRIRVAHQSGTQKTYAHNGDSEELITNNMYLFVEGNVETRIEGNETKYVEGNVTEVIKGNFTTSVMGRRKEVSSQGSEYLSSSNVNISGSRIDLNKGGGAAVEVTGGVFTYTPQYAYDYGAAADVVSVAGVNAAFDEPEDVDVKLEALDSGEYPLESNDQVSTTPFLEDI